MQEGDRVLVKIIAFEGKHKIADKWESEAYIVLKQPNSAIPVYEVQREFSKGPKHILHRNLLLPISSLPITLPPNTEKDSTNAKLKPVAKPRLSLSKRNKVLNKVLNKVPEKVKTDSSDSSESGSETVYIAQKTQKKRQVDHDTESNESTDSETERVHELNDGDQATNAHNINDDFPNDRVQPEEPVKVVETPPVPRRSKRTHTPVYWKRSGEYVHAQRAVHHIEIYIIDMVK